MALFGTVAEVVSDAAVECGLEAVSDVFGSTDPAVVQMRALLKSGGRALALDAEWVQLRVEASFVSTTDTSYNLPADFSRMLPQTAWNRSVEVQMQPVNGEVWQYLKATSGATAYTATFRPLAGKVELWPQPPASGETIAYEYLSRYWVALAETTTPAKDAPTLNTDVLLYDATLLVPMLIAMFRERRQLPGAEAARAEFERLKRIAIATSIPAHPALTLDRPGPGLRLLDWQNLPATGYG